MNINVIGAEMNLVKQNIIFVANKPMSIYITACKRVISQNKELIIKARGKSINTAVNLGEIIKRDNYRIRSIKTSTEYFKPEDSDREVSVSTIEITIIR